MRPSLVGCQGHADNIRESGHQKHEHADRPRVGRGVDPSVSLGDRLGLVGGEVVPEVLIVRIVMIPRALTFSAA